MVKPTLLVKVKLGFDNFLQTLMLLSCVAYQVLGVPQQKQFAFSAGPIRDGDGVSRGQNRTSLSGVVGM